MFEMYREAGDGRYRIVYFTELGEREREVEIDRAMAGEHFFGGYLLDAHKALAKGCLDGLLLKLNRGEVVLPIDVERALRAIRATAEGPGPVPPPAGNDREPAPGRA